MKLSKLKSLSLDEVRVRLAQKVAAMAERAGRSPLTQVPEDPELLARIDWNKTGRELWSAQELLEHFRTRSTPTFLVSFADRNRTVEELKARWPESIPRIIERADAILDGRFDLLGHTGLRFGETMDWHLEPISGKRTPLIHWSKLDYLDSQLAGDKKIVWELNRHQYFLTLGQAYWLTQDERYTAAFASHIQSWMDENPPKLGINWASSLEVGFRSISWLWSLYFFRDSEELSSRLFIRIWKFLYLNARHLETYLSTYFSPNTHLTGEALALYYLGLLLPEFTEANRWRETGKQILLHQLPIHVRPDGVYFEQSSYYHRYTTDFYIHFLILARANGDTVSPEVTERLQLLLDHLMYITQPDGTTPFFGDDDGGRLVMLDDRPASDFRAALSNGAALFDRPDYKFAAQEIAEETLWLTGPEVVRKLDRLSPQEPDRKSVAFEDGGYYVMRDDWSPNANYLLFDCGSHGQSNCGHAHADALSFELAANGRSLLVDPGTFTYTGSREMRDWFRSSLAHNTLTIDGRSSSIPAGPFSWERIAQCQPLAWISRERFDYVSGSHDGYTGGPENAHHERSILFLKKNYWILRDRVAAARESSVDLWFHFNSSSDPLIEAAPDEPAFIAESDGKTGLDTYSFGEKGHWRREEGWVSHCYSQRESSRVYVFSARFRQGDVVSFLLPWTDTSRRRVLEIEAVGGRAFEVTNENWLDIVMIRTAERVESARLTSDFEMTWARFSHALDAKPQELVLINGQKLSLEGREILKTSERQNSVFASLAGGNYQVEVDASNRQSPISNRQ
jgi:hypothetical protein